MSAEDYCSSSGYQWPPRTASLKLSTAGCYTQKVVSCDASPLGPFPRPGDVHIHITLLSPIIATLLPFHFHTPSYVRQHEHRYQSLKRLTTGGRASIAGRGTDQSTSCGTSTVNLRIYHFQPARLYRALAPHAYLQVLAKDCHIAPFVMDHHSHQQLFCVSRWLYRDGGLLRIPCAHGLSSLFLSSSCEHICFSSWNA